MKRTYHPNQKKKLIQLPNIGRAAKRDRLWKIEKTFPNSKEAFEFGETEKTWGFKYKTETNDGNKCYYRCNKPKLRGQHCPAGLYLLFDNRNNDKEFVLKPSIDLKGWTERYNWARSEKDIISKSFDSDKHESYCPVGDEHKVTQDQISTVKDQKPPPAAKNVPINDKRRRGRPKFATKALLRDLFFIKTLIFSINFYY